MSTGFLPGPVTCRIPPLLVLSGQLTFSQFNHFTTAMSYGSTYYDPYGNAHKLPDHWKDARQPGLLIAKKLLRSKCVCTDEETDAIMFFLKDRKEIKESDVNSIQDPNQQAANGMIPSGWHTGSVFPLSRPQGSTGRYYGTGFPLLQPPPVSNGYIPPTPQKPKPVHECPECHAYKDDTEYDLADGVCKKCLLESDFDKTKRIVKDSFTGFWKKTLQNTKEVLGL